jgi:HTH-type transcriptional regulator/antitoxin HigA
MPSTTGSTRKLFDGDTTMDIKPIKTKTDYRTALKEIEALMHAKPRTPQGDRLEVLVTLVEAYEAKHYPLDLPDPIEAIKYTMESKGLSVKDLEPMIGRSNRVYEILSRKRPLTLKMIWALHKRLGIPAECLIRQPKKARAA